MANIANHNSALCLTTADLRVLGKNEVAYVREYEVKGQMAFVLHAADGTALAVQKDVTAARVSARNQDLEIVSIH
jgi:hypothetical protein